MNTPKAPSPWPPRVTVCRDKDTGALNVIAAENFPSIPLAQLDFISRAEHIHLLAEAVRIAKAQAFGSVLAAAERIYQEEMDSDPSDYFYTKRAVEEARESELRKGATLTPENGGKDGPGQA